MHTCKYHALVNKKFKYIQKVHHRIFEEDAIIVRGSVNRGRARHQTQWGENAELETPSLAVPPRVLISFLLWGSGGASMGRHAEECAKWQACLLGLTQGLLEGRAPACPMITLPNLDGWRKSIRVQAKAD